MTNAPIIAAHGLNHRFGTGEARKQALIGIDLTVERGSFTVLMGPSGSGKTTLLTLLGCLRDVQDGSVRLMGRELRGASVVELIALRRRADNSCPPPAQEADLRRVAASSAALGRPGTAAGRRRTGMTSVIHGRRTSEWFDPAPCEWRLTGREGGLA
jgi:energy-coupling factor transporter ATP-binding protein EcfA2